MIECFDPRNGEIEVRFERQHGQRRGHPGITSKPLQVSIGRKPVEEPLPIRIHFGETTMENPGQRPQRQRAFFRFEGMALHPFSQRK